VTPFTRDDLPALAAFEPPVLRLGLPGLERALFENPYFGPECLHALRHRQHGHLTAVGLLIVNPAYALPKQLDAMMPCFRLGAFGTEGLTAKRINGMFSLLVQDPQQASPLGVDLMSYAGYRLQETDVETLAAQVSSDVPHLVRFYKQYFRPQGRFPIYERTL
jgi:hypothetical protein